jgi:two-component system response regulator
MKRVILLVEDNPADEKLTLFAFAKSPLPKNMVVVRDGAEALDYLLARAEYAQRDLDAMPAVVLLDLKLPRVDGFEVLRQIRQTKATQWVPVVVLTTSNEHEDLVRSYSLGANAYVRKPVDFSEFAEIARTIGLFWCVMNQQVNPHERVEG